MSDRLFFSLEQQGPGCTFSHFCALLLVHLSHPSNGLLVIFCIICGSIIMET